MAPAVVAGRVHQLLDPALRQVVTRAGRADCYILWRWSPHLRLKVFTVEENRIIPRRCCEGATRSAGQFQHPGQRGCSTSRQARHIYWPSVLRRRHSVRRCHRPWRALPRFGHGMVMCLGSGKPLAYGGARGASWPTSSTTFCYFPVWQHSSRGLSSRPRVCLSDAATPCLATLLGWCVQICENVAGD